MRIAVEGCAHGELDKIYASIEERQRKEGEGVPPVDLLLICGDFQSIRNEQDLESMAVPDKYKEIGNFWEYYTGVKKAPVTTIFIGGNHEASDYLWELFHGGWVAPNIYFLGFAGVVRFGGLRIGGLSGIYRHNNFRKGYFEQHPLTGFDCKSIYNVREFCVARLSLLREPIDIVLSHDWPTGIAFHGDVASLKRKKPYFTDEIDRNELGSPVNSFLLHKLKPRWWFSGHLHVKFTATVRHHRHSEDESDKNNVTPNVNSSMPILASEIVNPDEILIEDSDADDDDGCESGTAAPVTVGQEGPMPEIILAKDLNNGSPGSFASIEVQKNDETRFLALDKCLPRRDFLEIIDIPGIAAPENGGHLSYDEEWLAIVRATYSLITFDRSSMSSPSREDLVASVERERAVVRDHFASQPNGLAIPANFAMTAIPYDHIHSTSKAKGRGRKHLSGSTREPIIQNLDSISYSNPQTEQFCSLLGIPMLPSASQSQNQNRQ